MVLRYTLSTIGLALVVVHLVRTPREPTDVHPGLVVAPGAAACILAVWSFVARDPIAEEAATFAGVVVTGFLVGESGRAMAPRRLAMPFGPVKKSRSKREPCSAWMAPSSPAKRWSFLGSALPSQRGAAKGMPCSPEHVSSPEGYAYAQRTRGSIVRGPA